MGTDYRADRDWSDAFLPQIKRILGEVLLCAADDYLDMKRATDLSAIGACQLILPSMSIAVRVRRNKYFRQYPRDWTLRTDRDSGAVTELAKILEGHGDYYFYGFADGMHRRVEAWIILSLDRFRREVCYQNPREQNHFKYERRQNGPPDFSKFIAIDLATIAEDVIVACSSTHPLHQRVVS